MNSTRKILLSTTLMLAACATSTPIVKPLPEYKVPPLDPKVQAVESAAQSQMTDALKAWSKWLSDSQTATAPDSTP